MPRVVFDTVIFVRALLNPYSVCGRLLFRHAAEYVLVVSPPLVREMLDVLHRPELTSRFRRLTGLDLSRVLDIIGSAEVVSVDEIPPTSRDPNDDKVLATAASAVADFLVTQDNDLLVLGTYGGAAIVTAVDFVSWLEARKSERPPTDTL